MPVRKTTGNSSPFAEWSVMRVTPRAPSGSSSTSLTSATPSRKPSSVAGSWTPVVLGRGDQLLQVLEPRLGLGGPLRLQILTIAARVEDQVDERRQRRLLPLGREARHERGELLERAPGLAGDVDGRRRREREERPPPARRQLLQVDQRGAADAAAGRLDRAAEGDVVRRVHDEPEVRE